MQEKIFGTQQKLAKEAPTTKPISPELKALLDNKILEGKMPYLLENIAAFKVLIRQAYSFSSCE
jgi:hypothetical protein